MVEAKTEAKSIGERLADLRMEGASDELLEDI